MSEANGSLPVEQFIWALQSQLDRVQDTMALKVRAGRPLTFAVKDIAIDLRAHFEMARGAVHIRPAGPGEQEASNLHLALTTITRPMIEENTVQVAADPEEPSLRDALGPEVSEEEQRRLEWAGVHTVSQLRSLQQRGGEQNIMRVADIPVNRLRAALARAAEPRVSQVVPEPDGQSPAGTRRWRIRGRNLRQEALPDVRLDGQPVSVLSASPTEILVEVPAGRLLAGALAVETAPGAVAEAAWPAAEAAAAEEQP